MDQKWKNLNPRLSNIVLDVVNGYGFKSMTPVQVIVIKFRYASIIAQGHLPRPPPPVY